MAFQGAQFARASIGLLNASGYTTAFSAVNEQAALPVTVLTSTAAAFIVGQTSGSGSLDMVLDTIGTANLQYSVLTTWKSTQPTPLDIAPEGYATGNPVLMYNALQTQATTSAAVTGVAEAKVTFQGADQVDLGVSVEDYTAVTVTGNGTARDGLAASSNGGVAHLHVSAFATITSDVVTIEHSVDGSTSWATLVTFAAVTGLTSERVVVAAGTTVRRFLRVVDTVTGSGSVTRQVSFARR